MSEDRRMSKAQAVATYYEAFQETLGKSTFEQMVHARRVALPLLAKTGWPLKELQEEVIDHHFNLHPEEVN